MQLQDLLWYAQRVRAATSQSFWSQHVTIRLAACLALLWAPAMTAAQEEIPATSQSGGSEHIFLDDIPSVYSASKHEQKVTEAPSSVSIITSDEIKKYGYCTLADILQNVNGFFVTYDRDYSYLGIRGFNRPGDFNSRILLLIDGHRLNDNQYDQAGLGTEG